MLRPFCVSHTVTLHCFSACTLLVPASNYSGCIYHQARLTFPQVAVRRWPRLRAARTLLFARKIPGLLAVLVWTSDRDGTDVVGRRAVQAFGLARKNTSLTFMPPNHPLFSCTPCMGSVAGGGHLSGTRIRQHGAQQPTLHCMATVDRHVCRRVCFLL